MKLTKEELEKLDGKCGEVIQEAMELLIALGECYGAERMIPVTSAHLVGANPITAGVGGTIYIGEIAKKGGKFVIPTTTNPGCLDPWAWREMGFSEKIFQDQTSLSQVIAGIGGLVCNTCTPYLIGHVARFRDHVAWCESSAVIYVNAVLGARTNREGGPSALAAALTGRTPAYGYHLDENRFGELKVNVNTFLKGDTDYSTLGYFTGKIAQNRVPIFSGIPSSVSQHELKCLGAGLATSGSVAHYHVVGVTPEASTEEMSTGSKKITSSDVFEFGSTELETTEASLCRVGPEAVDLIILGCPHASIEQIKYYAELFQGRKFKNHVDIWILTSSLIKKYAEEIGFANTIEAAGARLVTNTCPSPMPQEFFRSRGYRAAATDSSKMAYYISATKGLPCYYGSLDKFIDVISKGR